jgi:ubiquinone/menaquinone biosynthesis C-methylase UbiE
MDKEKLVKKFDRQVKIYENNRENRTLAPQRKKLLKHAYGKVLEVGIGAGANFPYYSKDVYITGVDFSPMMINSAKSAANQYGITADLIVADVDELQFESDSFDCVVSTLTLCGYKNPVHVLNKFNDWCKEDGKILLLEHGLSSNRILSFTQKIINPIYKKMSGCHGNRDMLEIVTRSKLNIELSERSWADIFYLISAKPSR